MTDDIILKTLTVGSNIPFVDEDGLSPTVDHHRARPSFARRDLTKDTVSPGLNSRYAPSFTTFRSISQSRFNQEYEGGSAVLQKGAMNTQKEPQHRYIKQSSALKRNKTEAAESGPENPLQRYENAVLKYQKARPKRQTSRDRQQQQQNHGYSSSDESMARNKSKSISSIDTQSVNNILDEYEDLDYGRSSDLSDVGSISVTNFEAVMMDQQKKQQQDKSRISKTQPKCSPVREKPQPVLKVNQQTQVRQRSRERQRESVKHVPASPTEDNSAPRVPSVMLTVDTSRAKVPEVLLRKGEVQKRVDEWLSQTQSQNFSAPRDKPLTRSNSSADQKSQRRYRQDARSRSIDEGRDKLNGTSSSYDDLSRADKKDRKVDKVNVGVNTSRGTYKEYLALKNRSKQQDYGFSALSNAIGRSRDISPSTGSRIPQRGPLTSSFRSRRLESRESTEEGQSSTVSDATQVYQTESNCRGKGSAESRLTNLVKTRNESDHGRICGVSGLATGCSTPSASSSSSPSVIPCRRTSFKRSQNHDQSASGATRPLVKEETGQRARGGGSGPKGPSNLGDQGEPISPNKDGESRRPALTGDSPRAGDKAADAACKSMEASRSGDRPTRDIPRISGDSVESRYQRQDRRENRMEQTRQESVYGGVGARVRTLQGQQESRVTRPRNFQATGVPAEARKPPVLPRKEQIPCSQDVKGDRAKCSPIGSPQSSFKPNDRVYAALQQLNEQNSAKSRVPSGNESSPSRSHYSSPNHVEKIYERSLQPQVIHADDLESVLRPSLQVSAYGEGGTGRSDRRSPSKEAVTLGERNEEEEAEEALGEEEEEEVYGRVEPRYEHLETIEEDDQRSEASVCRYPEIEFSQCLKIQQALPNGRPRGSSEKRIEPAVCQPTEPTRTFTTFHSSSYPQRVKSNQQSRSTAIGSPGNAEHEERRGSVEPIMVLEDFEIAYDSGKLIDGSQPCHTRENSNLSTATIPLDELESERQAAKFKAEDACLVSAESADQTTDARFQDDGTKVGRADIAVDKERTVSREIEDRVVNEVLVKNLQFKQDLPRDSAEHGDSARIIEHVGQQKPIGFHNVLCDNYENVQDARFKGSKVYVTKEEMERQRLMDLLRKGDYESVKAVSDNRQPLCFSFSRACILINRFSSVLRSIGRLRIHLRRRAPILQIIPFAQFLAGDNCARYTRREKGTKRGKVFPAFHCFLRLEQYFKGRDAFHRKLRY